MTQKHHRVVAIYPGSFDPITNGHLDVIERGSRLFDRLIVSVLQNEAKAPLFSVEERVEMLRETARTFPNVEVDCFQGLLADYALGRNASVILRGIRAISDYEYELQMALMNRRLQPGLETIFLLAGETIFVHQFQTGEGSDRAGGQHLRPGAAAGGTAAARAARRPAAMTKQETSTNQ